MEQDPPNHGRAATPGAGFHDRAPGLSCYLAEAVGHQLALDGLAALALRVATPVVVLEPAHNDWSKLCGNRVIIREV